MIAFLLAQTIAITGGTVYPVSGPKLTNATVLIRDGKIVAVGTGVATPSDATRIDATLRAALVAGAVTGSVAMRLPHVAGCPKLPPCEPVADDLSQPGAAVDRRRVAEAEDERASRLPGFLGTTPKS